MLHNTNRDWLFFCGVSLPVHGQPQELMHQVCNPESLPAAKVEACKYNAAIAFLHYTAVRCEPISGQISKRRRGHFTNILVLTKTVIARTNLGLKPND